MTTKSYSNSEINEFDRCRLAYFYRYQQNLQRIDEDSGAHHQQFGKAIHSALESLYTKGDMKLAQQVLRENYPVQLDTNDLAKTADNGCFAIEKYWEHYDSDHEWEIVEVVESRHLREDGFGVKPDLVVKDHDDNILLIDHKTTGSYLNYDYFARYDPNSQVSHYMHWCREKYGHCDGFVVNAIRFAYLQRKSKDRAAGFNVEFERQTFQRNPSQIAITLRATDEAISDINHCMETGYWRPNEQPNACKFCSYKSLCAAGWNWDDDSELILSQFRSICDKAISATDEHCNLDRYHEGPCSSAIQQTAPVEFAVDI
jgi:CRISPR/Cas system-associated exonuclease Cas4 (RecB family)